MLLIDRRSLLRGLFAAPAIIAAVNLMPLRGVIIPARWSDAELAFGHSWNMGSHVVEKLVNLSGDVQYYVDNLMVDRNAYEAAKQVAEMPGWMDIACSPWPQFELKLGEPKEEYIRSLDPVDRPGYRISYGRFVENLDELS